MLPVKVTTGLDVQTALLFEEAVAVTGAETVVVAFAEVIQAPLVVVQVKVKDVPEVTVAVVEALAALPKVAVPPVTVHAPVPGDGLFPVNTTKGELEQTFEVAVADAVTGVLTVTAEVLALLEQGPFVVVQVNVAGPDVIEAVAVL